MFSRKFVDSQESNISVGGIINLHNNEAGRRVSCIPNERLRRRTRSHLLHASNLFKALRSRMERVCKCHGMSGSCSVRVCWRRLPPMRVVGEALGQLYDGASFVKV